MLERLTLATIDRTDRQLTDCIARRLRTARTLAGLSQVKMAELLGITFQQVQKYEKGANRICPAMLARVSRATGRSIGWFFDDVTEPAGRRADIVAEIAADRQFAEMLDAWRALSPSARATVLQMTRLLAELAPAAGQGEAA